MQGFLFKINAAFSFPIHPDVITLDAKFQNLHKFVPGAGVLFQNGKDLLPGDLEVFNLLFCQHEGGFREGLRVLHRGFGGKGEEVLKQDDELNQDMVSEASIVQLSSRRTEKLIQAKLKDKKERKEKT